MMTSSACRILSLFLLSTTTTASFMTRQESSTSNDDDNNNNEQAPPSSSLVRTLQRGQVRSVPLQDFDVHLNMTTTTSNSSNTIDALEVVNILTPWLDAIFVACLAQGGYDNVTEFAPFTSVDLLERAKNVNDDSRRSLQAMSQGKGMELSCLSCVCLLASLGVFLCLPHISLMMMILYCNTKTYVQIGSRRNGPVRHALPWIQRRRPSYRNKW